jgi:hypothetical protein
VIWPRLRELIDLPPNGPAGRLGRASLEPAGDKLICAFAISCVKTNCYGLDCCRRRGRSSRAATHAGHQGGRTIDDAPFTCSWLSTSTSSSSSGTSAKHNPAESSSLTASCVRRHLFSVAGERTRPRPTTSGEWSRGSLGLHHARTNGRNNSANNGDGDNNNNSNNNGADRDARRNGIISRTQIMAMMMA